MDGFGPYHREGVMGWAVCPSAIPNLYGGGDGSLQFVILSFPEKRDEYLTYIATLPYYLYICTCGSQSGFTPPAAARSG